MSAFNRTIIMGNLTGEVDLRYTQSKTAVTDVTVAINERRRGNDGETIEETTFVDVTLWGRTVEVAAEYLGKGSPVLIEGRLKLDTWETDGQKRSKLKVVAERMQMLGGNRRKNAKPADDGEPVTAGAPSDGDEDIPF